MFPLLKPGFNYETMFIVVLFQTGAIAGHLNPRFPKPAKADFLDIHSHKQLKRSEELTNIMFCYAIVFLQKSIRIKHVYIGISFSCIISILCLVKRPESFPHFQFLQAKFGKVRRPKLVSFVAKVGKQKWEYGGYISVYIQVYTHILHVYDILYTGVYTHTHAHTLK